MSRSYSLALASSSLVLSVAACSDSNARLVGGPTGTPQGAAGMVATMPESGAAGAPAAIATDLVVEDVEDGDTAIRVAGGRSGGWYGYSDAGTVSLDPTAVGHVGGGMQIAFAAVDSGWSGFGFNFAGAGDKEPYDASAFTGISFWIRADVATSLTFAVADVNTDPAGDICDECHDHWATSVSATTEWTQVTLHWSDLARGGWGTPATEAMIITQLIGLAWNVEAPGTVTVLIDDVTFLADGVASANIATVNDAANQVPVMVVDPGEGGLAWVEGGAPAGPTPVEVHGQLHVAGGQLLDEANQPSVLRGHAIAWDNWWPQYHNADVVTWLRNDWCVDVVRPAMGIEPEGAYLENAAASKARMTAVVDAAIANGIYVIIDWHAHDIHQDEAVAFFTEMAQTYGSNPNVIYEVFNEPDTDETWPEVKAYAEAVIAAIRVHDPDNVVIVGTPEWDQRIDLAVADPITADPNVIYSVHFYAATHGASLRSRVQAALTAGVPVFVSESGGSEADGMGANDYAEWDAWLAFLDENQISWINWGIADKSGETVSMLQPGAPATGAWTQADLTLTGVHVRTKLRTYNCP